MDASAVKIKDLSFKYPDGGEPVFSSFNMKIKSSSVTAILGPSGCGKTSLLNLVHGLLQPQAGSIETGAASSRKSYLFQEPRLLPWRTALQNIELVLKADHSKSESREIAARFLEAVGLAGFENYYPSSLSGGMRQRVAIARAFAYPAGMILMDEPFQALDLRLKMELTSLFLKLWTADNRTAVFVTHDINEALILGDEIIVLSGERPAGIKRIIENPLTVSDRNPDHPELMSIEAELYRLLTD